MHHPAPPQPPQKRSTRKTIGLGCAGISALCAVLIAIGSAAGGKHTDTDGKASAARPTATRPAQAPKPAPTALSKRKLTELSVGLVWDNYNAKQKDALCMGVDIYGTDWLAKQLRSDNIDADYAAELVSDRCATR